MKGILLTHKGMEDIAGKEVESLIKQKSKQEEGLITFPIKKHEDLFTLCYRSQSAGKVGLLLSEFSYKNIDSDFKKSIQGIKWNELIDKDETIQVRCKKHEGCKIPTAELEKSFSAKIIDFIKEKYSYKQPVDLNNPIIPISLVLNEKKCYILIDFAGFDISKRSHHIFTHPADIKGTIGYALASLSDLKEKDIFVDPFSGSGTIAIEATLKATKFPVNFYNKDKFAFTKFNLFKKTNFNSFFEKEDKKIKDKKFHIYNNDSSMKYIQFSKKNAQIAGILKNMEFRKMPLEWFDTKFGKGEVNKIVTKMPVSKLTDTEKNYKELFYQAEFVLNKSGSIVLIGSGGLIHTYSKKYNFNIVGKRNIYSGKEKYNVFVLKK